MGRRHHRDRPGLLPSTTSLELVVRMELAHRRCNAWPRTPGQGHQKAGTEINAVELADHQVHLEQFDKPPVNKPKLNKTELNKY